VGNASKTKTVNKSPKQRHNRGLLLTVYKEGGEKKRMPYQAVGTKSKKIMGGGANRKIPHKNKGSPHGVGILAEKGRKEKVKVLQRGMGKRPVGR